MDAFALTMTDAMPVISGIVAGAAGGLVRALTLREDSRTGTISVIVGAICATYITPFTQEVVHATTGLNTESQSFWQFATGLSGVVVVGLLLDATVLYKRIKLAALPSSKGEPPTAPTPSLPRPSQEIDSDKA